jgi:hypothetical protein
MPGRAATAPSKGSIANEAVQAVRAEKSNRQ